jgi:glycosyltransferase involved in cell wall biosynthesis
VLVLPSLDEGFGLPVLEAMSLGVPVVVSNRGALPDLVGDAGLIVDPDDVESIAGGLARVVENDALAETMRQRGLERARLYEWTNTARALRRTFEAAIAAAAARP